MEDNKKKRIYPERLGDGDLEGAAELEKLDNVIFAIESI